MSAKYASVTARSRALRGVLTFCTLAGLLYALGNVHIEALHEGRHTHNQYVLGKLF
jgi:hypothetical protein